MRVIEGPNPSAYTYNSAGHSMAGCDSYTIVIRVRFSVCRLCWILVWIECQIVTLVEAGSIPVQHPYVRLVKWLNTQDFQSCI